MSEEKRITERVAAGEHETGYYAAQPNELLDIMGQQVEELKGLRTSDGDGPVIDPENAGDFLTRLAALKMNAEALLVNLCDQAGLDPMEVENALILAMTQGAADSVGGEGG